MPYRLTYTAGHTSLDAYALPPVVLIPECAIHDTLQFATKGPARKHLAASIILGQPFNHRGTTNECKKV